MKTKISWHKSLRDLPREELSAILRFAESICKDLNYSFDKLENKYSECLVCYINDGIKAIQFLNSFSLGLNSYTYFGPLVSEGGHFIAMFSQWFQNFIETSESNCIYLLAEIQNPEIFLVFYSLFEGNCYPEIQSDRLNFCKSEIVEAFINNISHIGKFDNTKFTTYSGNLFFKENKKYSPVINWMHSNNVYPEQGDCQLLLVSFENLHNNKEQVIIRFSEKIQEIRNWQSFRNNALKKFTNSSLYV